MDQAGPPGRRGAIRVTGGRGTRGFGPGRLRGDGEPPAFGQGLAHGEAQAAGPPGHERADSFEIWRRFGHAADPTPLVLEHRGQAETAHTAR